MAWKQITPKYNYPSSYAERHREELRKSRERIDNAIKTRPYKRTNWRYITRKYRKQKGYETKLKVLEEAEFIWNKTYDISIAEGKSSKSAIKIANRKSNAYIYKEKLKHKIIGW